MDPSIKLLQVLPISAGILLPGFVWIQAQHKFVPRARLGNLDLVLTYLLNASLAYSITAWIHWDEVAALRRIEDVGAWLGVRFVLTGFAVGLLGGVVSGLLRRGDLIGTICDRFRVQTIHPLDCAWDRAFGRREGCLVRLTFKDGEDRYGILGTKSLVSTETDERDIYLERMLIPSKEGGLIDEPSGLGIWVSAEVLECVRFYEYEGLGQHARKNKSTKASPDDSQ